MDTKEKVSVIVPAYNVAEWLSRCLDSILAQTYKELEILVIDDGSTDETPQIVDDYAAKDSRIVAIHQNNRGLAETRDRGIREATGTMVGFVDGDDEIIPEMYEKLVKNALCYDADISQCGMMYCFYDGRRKPIHGTGKLTVFNRLEGCSALLDGTVMEPSLCNKIYRASLLKDSCLDSSIKNNEDMLRNIVLFNRAERSVLEDFCGYLYWRRGESMSNNRKAIEIGKNILDARSQIMEYVPAELKGMAQENYISGAIVTYNSLIRNQSAEACELRQHCKMILKENCVRHHELPRKIRMKSFFIINLPFIYDKARTVHARRRRKKIRKQAEMVRQTAVSGESET